MIKQTVLLLLANLLITQVSCTTIENVNFKPKDIFDDANALLKNLSDIVQGNIIVAHSQIGDIALYNFAYRDNIALETEFDIQEESQTIEGELDTIKNLAQAADKNISSCLEVQEPLLHRLPDIFIVEVQLCINATDDDAQAIVDKSLYNVDVTINKVHELEFQLGRCGENDADCVSKVITQIRDETVNLPQQIKAEVVQASELSEYLRVTIRGCSDSTVAGFASTANSILLEIIDCVNEIIS